jgi:GNAT superfamily N-acetyltransferase
MDIVEITAPGPLLDAVYTDVLVPSFPPDELVSLEDLREGLAAGGGTSIAATVDAAGRPLAAAAVDWSASTAMLLLSYLAVRPGRRGGGHGAALLRYARGEWFVRHGARMLLAEVEDPRAHAASAGFGDPAARVRFYDRHGGRALDLPYFQPALGPGRERVYGVFLVVLAWTDAALGAGADRIAAEPVRRFLAGYLGEAEGGVGSDPAVAALWRALDRPDGIPLLALTDPALPRSVPPP